MGCGKQRETTHLRIPGKTAALVSEFAVVDLPSGELQPWFLSLLWNTCLWAELQSWFLRAVEDLPSAELQPCFLSFQ